MNHFVPDFDDYVNNPHSSSLNLPRKSIMGHDDDDLMELLWQNGQVVAQNQRLNNNNKKPSSSPPSKLQAPSPSSMHHSDQNLFIQEDEMTSWLHYPLRDDDFSSDLLFSAVSAAAPTQVSSPRPPVQSLNEQMTSQVSAPRPPVRASNEPMTSQVTAPRPPVRASNEPMTSQVSAATPPVPSSNEQMTSQVSAARPPVRNFMNFSRLRSDFTGGRGESRPLNSKPIVRESTQVSPTATPASETGLTRRTDDTDSGLNRKGKAVAVTAPVLEIPGTSSKSEIEPEKTNVDERKRKEREATEETECRSEETKGARGSTSTKRSRAAEVHNLSERKRRDRINERMKALQELIPRCNKSDKASMLDEAIEYMKSLQLQIQMMSMGCGVMPMMYPGMQQYMPHMAMGMGMNQPLPPPSFMPFPNMLAAQRPLPTQTPMGGGSVFSAPKYPLHPSHPSRVYVQNQQCNPTSSQPQYPGYIDPYQQFRSVHPSQPPQFQNQATSYPSSSRVSSSKDSEYQGNHTTG